MTHTTHDIEMLERARSLLEDLMDEKEVDIRHAENDDDVAALEDEWDYVQEVRDYLSKLIASGK